MKKRITTSLAAAAIALATGSTPAAAVEPAELSDARSAYRIAQLEIAERAQELMLAELRTLNGPYDNMSDVAWDVERWRPVVATYFPENRIDWALDIISCESHGDPLAKNPRSSASGLFQHLARLWPERAAAAGWEGADVFDPTANIAVSAWLLDHGGTSHWVCKARN